MAKIQLRKARLTFVVTISAVASTAMFVEDAITAEIEEIVVTATKREARLQDVPLAVSVLTSTSLESAGVRDLLDLPALVPSLDVAQSTGPLSTSLLVRRIGNLGNIPNFESAVGVFVDDAFRNRAGAAIGDLFDVAQIEIARGPQTTMHGKNATAGLISIATNPPGDEFDARGEVTVGAVDTSESADLLRVEGVINAPLSSTTSMRAGGVIYRHDATLANLFNGDDSQDSERYSVRGQLRYTAGDRLEARLIGNRQRVDSARMGDLVLFEGNLIQAINGGFGAPCPEHDIDDWHFCRNDASIFDLTSSDLTLNIRAEVGGLLAYSISSFEDYDSHRDFDADQLNIEVVRIIDRQQGSSFSQELRLTGEQTANLAWLVGAFYFDSEFNRGSASRATAILGPDAPNLDFAPGIPVGDAGNQGFFDSDSQTRHLSVFGNVDWVLNDTYSVGAGLRWQTEDKKTRIVNSADHVGPSAITMQLMPTLADASLSRDTTGVSWEITGRYRWNETSMAYLLASRGFKSGGFNAGFGATPPQSREFGDEKVNNLELGFKSVLMDNRLRINVAAFAARYRDFQSAGWVSLRFLVNNAERVNVRGVEIDLQSALHERLALTTSLSWVDARYDRYSGGSCYYNRPPDNTDGTGCDLSGRTLPFAPRTRANIGLNYERPVEFGTFYGRIDWSWSSDYHTNSALDPRHVQQAHSIVNARIGFQVDRYDISAWVRNAGDQLVVTREGPSNLFPRDPAFGRAFLTPRTYGVSLSIRL